MFIKCSRQVIWGGALHTSSFGAGITFLWAETSLLCTLGTFLLGPNLLLSAPGGIATSRQQALVGQRAALEPGKLFNMLDRRQLRDTQAQRTLVRADEGPVLCAYQESLSKRR